MKIVTCPGGGESHKNGHLSRWGGGVSHENGYLSRWVR